MSNYGMRLNCERLIREMRNQGVSLQEISDAVHVSIASISKWRTGKKNITKEHLFSLARALNVSPSFLVMEDEIAKPTRPDVILTIDSKELRRTDPQEVEIEGRTTFWYVCPECRGSVDKWDRFCRHCGQALKCTEVAK